MGRRGRAPGALAHPLLRRQDVLSGRWVAPPPEVFAAVAGICPRDDRVPDRPVFGGFGADRFRTALTRACTGAGIASFPHDLRHRRVSLLHAQGLPWARIGELVGHADLVTTARTYTHVLVDEREIEYADLVRRPPGVNR